MSAVVVFPHNPPGANPDRVAFVQFRGEQPVRVRFRPPGIAAWRCDRCWRSAEPECRHARAVVDELERQAAVADGGGPA